MLSHRNKSVTLIELIVAMVLVAVIILGINSISLFSNYQLISSDRRAKVQNEISYCLEHITKHVSAAIGNEVLFGNDTVVVASSASNPKLAVFIDANANGLRDVVGDYWINYYFNSGAKEFRYCGNCGASSSCAGCNITEEVLSKKISAFIPSKNFTNGNYAEVVISGRWDPSSAVSQDNPEVTMRTTLIFPSISTH
jgi:Tfp pilus assembly protein PilE